MLFLFQLFHFCPQKDAVTTSFLSRRWRNLYRLSPAYSVELSCIGLFKHALVNNLGFRAGISSKSTLYRFLYNVVGLGIGYRCTKENPHSSEISITSLDSFLSLHSGYEIQSFRLSCCLNKSATGRFEQCISALGILAVENLSLECCCPDRKDRRTSDLSFSCHLFTKMPSLKHFKLSKCSLQPSLTSQCNSLQTIVLHRISVSPGAIECILSDCLRVNSLTISKCISPHKLRFCGPHLELKSLYIDECRGLGVIQFHASNLVVFEFWTHHAFSLIFDHVPQLQSVFLYAYHSNLVPYVFGRLSLDLPNLKSLNFVTSELYNRNVQDVEINTFRNLRRLDIKMHHQPKIDLHLLSSILQHCPLLQEFHLIVNLFLWSNGPQVETQAAVYHSELKRVEIDGFGGLEYDMELALYILRSAINLEKMYISRSFRQYEVYDDGGRGTWCVKSATPWSEEVQGWIHARLQGQAVSEISRVIIRHDPPDYED